MKLTEIKAILGGDVSKGNTKMPGTTFGLSTDFCNVGGALRDVPGSVCASCYAERLENFRPSVKRGWTNRAEAVMGATKSNRAMSVWVGAMVIRLTKLNPSHHRWHDSGDLLNYEHLHMLVDVALRLPEVSFWLPTKEKALVNRYLREYGKFPSNLTVRLSAPMVDQRLKRCDIPTSMVVTEDHGTEVWMCPARNQSNSCGDCRACWDTGVQVVAYPKH